MAKRAPRHGEGKPSKYKIEYCEKLIEHLSKGFSYDTFAAVVDVHVDTLYEWEKVHPEYSDAKKQGVMKSRYFWENVGMHGMTGKLPGFVSAVWIFNMKNRFKWHDNVKIQNVPDPEDKTKDNTIDKLSQQLAQLKAIANDSTGLV